MKRINSYTQATTNLASSYQSLQDAESGFKKSLWMSSIKNGAKMTKEEIGSLKAATKTYSDSAKQFITDSQYVSNESVTMLMGNSKAAKDILKTTNDYYGGQQKKLNSLTSKLSSTMDAALKDGKLSFKEEESINNLRAQIAKITNEIAKEEFEVSLENVKMNIEDGNLTADSFAELISSAQKKADEMSKKYEEAAARSIRNINKGKGSPEQKKKQINQVKWGDDLTGQTNGLYKQKVDVQLEVGNVGIEGIKEAFSSKLGVLGGDISKLISSGVTPEISSALANLGKDDKTRAALGELVKSMEPTTKQIQGLANSYKKAGKAVPQGLTDYMNSVEFFNALSQGPEKAMEWLNNKHLRAEPKVDVNPKVNKGKKKKVKGSDVVSSKTTPAKTSTKVESKLEKRPKKIINGKTVYGAKTTPVKTKTKVISKVEKGKPKKINTKDLVDTRKNPEVKQSIRVSGKAIPGKKVKLPANQLVAAAARGKANVKVNASGKKGKVTKAKVKGSDLAPKSVKATTTVKITGKKSIQNKISVSASDFGIPDSVNKTVTVNVSSNKVNVGGQFRGGIVGSGKIKGFAGGGYVQGGTQLATLAEEGTPEAIIPLGAHRRKRALELYARVGKELGVLGYAAGGIVGGSISGGGSSSGRPSIGEVNLNVYTQEGQSVLDAMREQKEELADELAGIINDGLSAQYENTPARG